MANDDPSMPPTNSQTGIKTGPVTSCESPEGAYVYFAPVVLAPDCPAVLHTDAAPGAARCPMLAAAAFDRAFSLTRRLGVRVAMVAPAKVRAPAARPAALAAPVGSSKPPAAGGGAGIASRLG